MTLDDRIQTLLEARVEAGIALYRQFHLGGPITSMEQLWTEDDDWQTMVAHRKNALENAPIIAAQVRSRLAHADPALTDDQINVLVDSAIVDLRRVSQLSQLSLQAIVTPYEKSSEGQLIRAVGISWSAIVDILLADWTAGDQFPFRKWEELIAGAFDRAGYDEVVLTPRSGDHGRDVIAVKNGVGSIRIIDSVKAIKPGNHVSHDDVRALAGVLLGDHRASKGILTTTADFAPRVRTDPFIAPLLPYRLELMDGVRLREWLITLRSAK